MIFPKAEAIANGRKQTHRVAHRPSWRPGLRIAVQAQPRGPKLAYIEITSTDKTTLTGLTRPEAEAEGHGGARGPLAHKRAWLEQHDRAWVAKHQASDEGLSDETVAQRFTERHVGTPITILRFRLCEEPDLYLTNPIAGKSGDYTTSQHRSFDELPVAQPTDAAVRKAREEGEKQRASFRKKLEAERARVKAERIPKLREQAQRRKDKAA